MRVPATATLALVGLLLLGDTTVPAGPRSLTPAPPSAVGGFAYAEHRYRIIGKIRLLLFWASGDNVGGARMTSRREGETTTLAFLVGSDPQRAPRKLNEWGYLREEVQSDRADVFALRSLDAEADAPRPETPSDEKLFSVSCASFTSGAVRNARTTVNAGGVTYRMFDRLLDQLAASPKWQEQQMSRPPGAAEGLLTAMQQVIRAGRTDSRRLAGMAPITYVYNNAIYDLSVRKVDWQGRTRVGQRTFDRLIRADLAVQNRTTGFVNRFGTTFCPDRSGPELPVQIFLQPSFWLRIELRLDESADVPADPAADDSVLTRIRAICEGVRPRALPSSAVSPRAPAGPRSSY